MAEEAKPLHLRFKFNKGCQSIDGLTTLSTMQDLVTKLCVMTSIEPGFLKVLNGFPPRPIDLKNSSDLLATHAIKSGDTLIVQEDEKAKIKRNEIVLQDYEKQMNSGVKGSVLRHVVPADNSCLFRSVHFVMNGGKEDPDCVDEVREVIAKAVSRDPVKFNEAYLAKSNSQYQEWIREKGSWGGAIDLAILSDHYGVEICVGNIHLLNLTRYGEDHNYPERVLLIYDGTHYDPLYLEAFDSAASKQTKFSCAHEAGILNQVQELLTEAYTSRQYTDTSKFTLRCAVCQVGLVGEKEAQEHAKKTGHQNFAEF